MTPDANRTHEVFNQSPPYGGLDLWKGDPLLRRIARGAGDPAALGLDGLGQWAGHGDTLELARLANRNLPILRTHDSRGARVDVVDFHPAWHAFMRKSMALGLHASIWDEGEGERGVRHLSRALRYYLVSQAETGHLCPITMTSAGHAALATTPALLAEWSPRLASRRYDSSVQPPGRKSAVTLGMGMTEKQGGSDVRANTTRAEPAGEGLWRITGHKWFFSAPMCDAFLVTAQMATPGGEVAPGCFLVPRLLPDGRANGFRFQRLKDKLGNRSNASSEVEFAASLGQLVGEPGRGITTILEMVTLTRLDCAIGSAAMMRAAVSEAVFHTRHRAAFGRPLVDQPVMTRVLADMALDVAGATALSFRLAGAFDRARVDEAEAAYARVMTPAVKYWVCKSAGPLIGEAMECLGGNGYVEDGNLARLYRDAPVNAIWEGSGNIMALDLMRVVGRDAAALDAVLERFRADLGGMDKAVDVLRSAAAMALDDPGAARLLTEQIALTAAAAELRRLGLERIADSFIESRLGGLWRATYGMLDGRLDARAILDRLYPV